MPAKVTLIELDGVLHKACSTCNRLLPTSDFGKLSFTTTGLHSWCKDCASAKKRAEIARLKAQVYDHYGRECVCCGETIEAFLSLDHIDDSGADHRRKVRGGSDGYRWIIKNNYPENLRVLCHNCNVGRMLNSGICPHEGGDARC